MTFLHPEFLYFMLPPVIILFVFLLMQQEQIADFFSAEVIEKLRVRSKQMSLRTRNLLFMLMSILLIIAMAQPVIEEGKVKVEAKSADLMIALDISDSMLAEDVYPSRLEQAKQKILDLLSMTPQERIGVMAFAKESYLVAPLSFDHRAVSYLVKQLQPAYLTEKGTDLRQLLRSAGEMMKEREKKYLLILSDGGDEAAFSEEIALAKELGITVFVLGMGTEKGAPIKLKEGGFIKQNGAIIISKLNSAVAELATQTGGSYIGSVTGSEDVSAMLDEIAAKTTKRTLAEEEIMQYEQLFYYPLALAMLLLLIATSSMSRRHRVDLPAVFVAAVLFMGITPSQAGLLDFKLLEEARQAYAKEDYNASAALYGDYAQRSNRPEALYDHANALYKKGEYAAAVKAYQQVKFEAPQRRFDTLHNLGNALAKQGTAQSLPQAVAAYEEALSIKEEKPTRENLERVKELLKEQQQEDGNSEEPGDQQEQKETSDDQGDTDQKQKSDHQDSQQQKSDQQRTPSEPKGEQAKSEQQQQQEGDQQVGGKQDKPFQKEDEPKQQKSAKPEDNEEEKEKSSVQSAQAEENGMSDLEEKKWLKMLSEQPSGHIYRVTPMKEKREDTHAKPW